MEILTLKQASKSKKYIAPVYICKETEIRDLYAQINDKVILAIVSNIDSDLYSMHDTTSDIYAIKDSAFSKLNYGESELIDCFVPVIEKKTNDIKLLFFPCEIVFCFSKYENMNIYSIMPIDFEDNYFEDKNPSVSQYGGVYKMKYDSSDAYFKSLIKLNDICNLKNKIL